MYFHSLGDVLKDIHGLLGLIVFKGELGAHIVYVNLRNSASNIQKKLARSRNGAGECLTDSYINCKSHLLWRCNKNHQWYATLSHVKTIRHGVHIALNINAKDCVEKLCQNILDRHVRYVDLIFLKL